MWLVNKVEIYLDKIGYILQMVLFEWPRDIHLLLLFTLGMSIYRSREYCTVSCARNEFAMIFPCLATTVEELRKRDA